jgi:hypothetical protein
MTNPWQRVFADLLRHSPNPHIAQPASFVLTGDGPTRFNRVASGKGVCARHSAINRRLLEAMIIYEQKLNHDIEWALREGSMHFDHDSSVHRSLRKICEQLQELGIPYAVVGGMAMFFHGYRRFTEDVDILVTPQGLAEAHQKLEGAGYVPPFPGSKQLRDTDTGVRIEFLVTGSYPGDGKPKPVSFPNPEEVATDIDGLHIIKLPKLIELKLASGMTNPSRLRDLADVQELIKSLKLPEDMGPQLDPSVAEKYRELWQACQDNADES